MGDYGRETERFYFGRKQPPHCSTCICQEVKVRSKITLSPPKRKPQASCCLLNPDVKYCPCVCNCPLQDKWGNKKASQNRYSPNSAPKRVERKIHPEHKYGLLESWFKRFDFDSNGLLDLHELKTLLNFLGVEAKREYVERLLDEADRDGDGCLSFPEFLLMWRQGAQEEEELREIIREHDLFPDVIHVERFQEPSYPKPRKVVETMRKKHDRRCGCENTITKTIRSSPKNEVVEIEKKFQHSPVSHREKFPLFSCHR